MEMSKQEQEWFGPVLFKAILEKGIDAFPKGEVKEFNQTCKECDAGEYPAIYRIEAPTVTKNRPCKVLQVGQAGNLFYRIGIFIGAALGFKTMHSEGKEFYQFRKALQLTIQDLQLCWKKADIQPGWKKKSREAKKRKREMKKRLDKMEKEETRNVVKVIISDAETEMWVLKFRKAHGLKDSNVPIPILMSVAPGGKKIYLRSNVDKTTGVPYGEEVRTEP